MRLKLQKKYKPNHISAKLRFWYIVMSLVFLTYGTLSVIFGEMYLPTKKGGPLVIHGFPMWFTYFAMLCAAANLTSIIVDHYDHRDNEKSYKKFAVMTAKAGGFFFLISLVLLFLFILSGKKL